MNLVTQILHNLEILFEGETASSDHVQMAAGIPVLLS